MTTSTSNASAETPRAHARATPPERDATPKPKAVAETTRTLASRFIVLAICLALVLSTLAFGTVHSWSLAIFQAGAALIVVAWAIDAWRTRALRVSGNLLQLPIVGLILLGLIQLLPLGGAPGASATLSTAPLQTLSLDPYATRFVLIQLASLFVYFAAALAFVDTPKRLRLIVRTVVIFGFALAVFSVILSFVVPDRVLGIREMKQSLGFGPFINRHHFAGFMEMALALPLGLLFAGGVERERRMLYIFAVAIMGIAIILTNSRGGMLSLVAEIMFLVLVSGIVGWRGRRREESSSLARRLVLRAAVGFAIVLVLFTSVIFFGGEDALNRLVGTVSAEDPTTGRVHFWRGTLGIITAHPFIGVGLGAFSLAYSQYDTSTGKLFRLEQAHNDYLQMLSDAGIVGALLGLCFVVVLFWAGFRRMQSQSSFGRGVALGALAGCFAVLVHSFFDFPLHTVANALLFLLLAALATLNGRVEQPIRRRRQHQRRRAAPVATSIAGAAAALGQGDEHSDAIVQPSGED